MRVRMLAIENVRGIKSGEADRQALAQSAEPQFREASVGTDRTFVG
jgi:hypothetical protein